MARAPRIFSPGAIYHVYCRTARGEMVFSDRFEADTFVETVADVKRLHCFLVLGWALMGDHDHLNPVAARLIEDPAYSRGSRCGAPGPLGGRGSGPSSPASRVGQQVARDITAQCGRI